MAQTAREIVKKALTFDHPERMPRDIWRLPWAEMHIPDAMAEIDRRWPCDFEEAPSVYNSSSRVKGDAYAKGQFVDEWGCEFENILAGGIGEVKSSILIDLEEWESVVRPPWETLPKDVSAARDLVNRACAASDKFVMGGLNPRPWERYQFLRGTENAMMDVMDSDSEARDVIQLLHEFFMKECEFWCSTDIDGFRFMDDWGSQTQLLIPPPIWRDLFKPIYKDYCDIAHASGKFAFMHSDGYISEIFDDLIEVGVDALNSQVFCMDMADLGKRGKGKISFWGEIDRQHVLPSLDPDVGRQAVRKVASHLFDLSGGCFVQFEAGLACNPETAIAVMEEWDAVQREAGMNP